MNTPAPTRALLSLTGALASLLGIDQALAASGIFGTSTVLDVNGISTLYATTLLNDNRHDPVNVTDPTFALGGYPSSLGAFNPGSGDSLRFLGAGILTFKNGTDNITGATVKYRVNDGIFNAFGLLFNANLESNGDQRWYGQGANVNLLSGLPNGDHTLDVFYEANFTFDGGGGTHVQNAGGLNYTVSFSVIPEPSAALASGLLAMGLFHRRRALLGTY